MDRFIILNHWGGLWRLVGSCILLASTFSRIEDKYSCQKVMPIKFDRVMHGFFKTLKASCWKLENIPTGGSKGFSLEARKTFHRSFFKFLGIGK